jgi:hypothetical protein
MNFESLPNKAISLTVLSLKLMDGYTTDGIPFRVQNTHVRTPTQVKIPMPHRSSVPTLGKHHGALVDAPIEFRLFF